MEACVKVCRCLSQSPHSQFVLAGISPIEVVADESKRVHSAAHWISLASGKALDIMCDVTLHK